MPELSDISILLERALNEAMSSESVIKAIDSAIENRYQTMIVYNDKSGKPVERQVEIYARGISKAGNDIIRGFQRASGRSKLTKQGVWKTFRVDRIAKIRLIKSMLNQFEDEPRNATIWKSAPAYNKNGDRSMITVIKQVNFGKRDNFEPKEESTPVENEA